MLHPLLTGSGSGKPKIRNQKSEGGQGGDSERFSAAAIATATRTGRLSRLSNVQH
jgi:hypothetical protein